MDIESKFANVMAEQLANKQISLESKHNTIFTAMSDYGNYNELVTKAINGIATIVKDDINSFRNEILPVSVEMEKEVKAKATIANVNVADKVSLHVYNKSDAVDIARELNVLNTEVRAELDILPGNPLIIEYDDVTAKEALVSDSIQLSDIVKGILLEYPDNYLETLHTKYFSNISKNNPNLKSLRTNVLGDFNDIFILYMLTNGYITHSLGPTNMRPEKARMEYLYKLRDYLATLIKGYETIYDNYLKLGTLVVKVVQRKDRVYDIYLIGENYDKYLDNHSIEGLIGLAVDNNDGTSVDLETVINNYEYYVKIYNELARTETIKASSERFKLLRLAYKIVLEEKAKELKVDYKTIRDHSDQYIDNLSNEELLDLTKHSRYLTAVYLYNNEEFLFFTDSMDYYSKLNPKASVDEIATMAMVALSIYYVKQQISIIRG